MAFLSEVDVPVLQSSMIGMVHARKECRYSVKAGVVAAVLDSGVVAAECSRSVLVLTAFFVLQTSPVLACRAYTDGIKAVRGSVGEIFHACYGCHACHAVPCPRSGHALLLFFFPFACI